MSSTTFDVELKGSHFSFVYLKSLNRQFVKRILTLQAKGIKFVYSLIVTSLFTFQMKSDRIKPINVGERCCCKRTYIFLVRILKFYLDTKALHLHRMNMIKFGKIKRTIHHFDNIKIDPDRKRNIFIYFHSYSFIHWILKLLKLKFEVINLNTCKMQIHLFQKLLYYKFPAFNTAHHDGITYLILERTIKL